MARLTGIPGIGKKTAERIVLELKDRLAELAVPAAAGAVPDVSADDRLRADLLSALQNLGYHRPQAETGDRRRAGRCTRCRLRAGASRRAARADEGGRQ